MWNHGHVGLFERWDAHNQRVLERHAQKAANEKPEDYDGAVAVSSGGGAIEIGVFTFPVGIGLLVFGAGWQRLLGLPILVVGGLCVWSLGRDVAEVVRRRRRRN